MRVAIMLDKTIKRELEDILAVYDNDNCSAWDMAVDGSYLRRRPAEGEEPRAAQEQFIKLNAALAPDSAYRLASG